MNAVATAAALCAALATVLALEVLRRLCRPDERRGRVPAVLPWPLRAAWPLSRPLLAPLRSLVPVKVRAGIDARLLRCDLDGVLTVEQWLALRVVWALLPSPAASVLASLLQWPVPVCAGATAALSWGLSGHWLAQRRAERERRILKDLPASLDVLTLCVEAGATLTSALRMLVDKSDDTPLRAVFARILREVRAGRTRLEALEHVARVYRLPCLDALVMALLQSESAGMSLGTVLRAQAGQRAAERHQRAERLALQAPVKMLAPLVLCIFPCTFVVLAVPVVARLLPAAAP